MNVLLTSSGRRTYLVDFFRQALEGEGLVFASNSEMSPALTQADGYGISPLICSEEYINWLLRFAQEHGVGLIVPLFDIDLPVLARNRKAFEEAGIVLAVSDTETVETAEDKYRMYRELIRAGIGCPESTLRQEEAEKWLEAGGKQETELIVKPRFGMGSLGLFTAENTAELRVMCGKCRRKIRGSYLKYESAGYPEEEVLIQRSVPGREYGLDVICDFQGNYRNIIVRRKLAMRSGETDEAVILGKEDPEYGILAGLGRQLAGTFRIRGIMDVDVMMDPSDGRPYVIDMNARFGGGYPFSHAAGADLPRAYLAWAQGTEAEPSWLSPQPGVHGYKDIVIRTYGCVR